MRRLCAADEIRPAGPCGDERCLALSGPITVDIGQTAGGALLNLTRTPLGISAIGLPSYPPLVTAVNEEVGHQFDLRAWNVSLKS
jgi:hypothetical protein